MTFEEHMDAGNEAEDHAYPISVRGTHIALKVSDSVDWIIKIHPRTETEPARIELNPTMAFERAVERFVEAVNRQLNTGPVSTR